MTPAAAGQSGDTSRAAGSIDLGEVAWEVAGRRSPWTPVVKTRRGDQQAPLLSPTTAIRRATPSGRHAGYDRACGDAEEGNQGGVPPGVRAGRSVLRGGAALGVE
jgi:hypothetical protein